MTKLGFYTLFTVSLVSLVAAAHCRHSGGYTGPPYSPRTTNTGNSGNPYKTNPGTTSTSTSTSTSSASTSTGAAVGGYHQVASGNASFTTYNGCGSGACGYYAKNGYTAAMSQFSFGAAGGQGAGDACGRCFAITATKDPYSPQNNIAQNSIVVKATDLCPQATNENWCGQSKEKPLNQVGMGVHFDLCHDSGASDAFFPANLGALTGHYQEVPCSHWSGTDSNPLWNGACIAGETAAMWPAVGCGNKGTAP